MAANDNRGEEVIERVSAGAIERVLALVSHELRTPMTSLKGAIELLQSCGSQNPKEIESLLLVAANNTDRLARVIETILDWSHITYEESPLFRQPCDITQILQEVIAELAPLATEHHVEMQLAVTDQLTLLVDSYFLQRALVYVVHNAIQFSPQGSRVSITTTAVPASPCPVPEAELTANCGLVTIQDQGIGIPPDFIEKIFQPFLQVDSSDSRSHQGLGLELAICRQIIQRHGGHIWANSTLGQGSTFYIALPLAT
jgi:signal transduction histidine kinase